MSWLVKELKGSFRIMIIKLFINQLKLLEVNSKQYFYNILHKKLNLWSDLDYSQFSSNIYKALHYAKYQKNFPTINILYIIDGNYLNVFLISIISVIINSKYENINFIVFYNNINPKAMKQKDNCRKLLLLPWILLGTGHYNNPHH